MSDHGGWVPLDLIPNSKVKPSYVPCCTVILSWEAWKVAHFYILKILNNIMFHKSKIKQIASERIEILFKQAKLISKKSLKLADRYVQLARKIAMKAKVKIPVEYKRKFCKHCYSYLIPGKTSRVRIHKGRTIYYCLKCKKYMRFQH